MDKQTMATFINTLAKSYGKQPMKGKYATVLSVPAQSAVDSRIFFEFFLVKYNAGSKVAINLCVQENGDMKRIGMLYVEGFWNEQSSFTDEVKLFITNNKQGVFETISETLMHKLYASKIVEESFFPSMESEESKKYSNLLTQR